jgi:very-short-patch-repair endonuclease
MSESKDADEVKRMAKQTRKSQLEERFLAAWRFQFPQLPAPTMQHKFHPRRLWRFDFSWPDSKLAVEIDGGSFVRGGHSRGAGQAKDFEKHNAAVQMGWRLLRFNTKQMDDVSEVVDFVAEVLCDAKEV